MAITVRGLTPLLEVFDLPTSIAFYRDVLGFELVSGGESWWCMLKLGEATLMLNTAYEEHERPPAPEPARVRGHADTSLYFLAPDPDEVYAHLREKGWSVTEPATTSYGMRQVSTRDPDGFQLFFLCPTDSKRSTRPPASD
jgi:glyoxylase I family protein